MESAPSLGNRQAPVGLKKRSAPAKGVHDWELLDTGAEGEAARFRGSGSGRIQRMNRRDTADLSNDAHKALSKKEVATPAESTPLIAIARSRTLKESGPDWYLEEERGAN